MPYGCKVLVWLTPLGLTLAAAWLVSWVVEKIETRILEVAGREE
jgi:cytochrome c-type biogenesis protein CcmH/NrfF